MHEMIIISFLHPHEVCSLVIITLVMCLELLSKGYMYEYVLLPLLLYCGM